jgi:small subunit ribosomal protein S6
MFLVDSALATADWEGTLGVVENILKRADAEVVAIRKWGERKLAYDIDHKTRGTYILAYFKADGRRIAGIEKDVLLSEKIMRVLILGTEKRPPELIEADIKGLPRVEPVEGAREAEESYQRRDRREMGRDYEPAEDRYARRGARHGDDAER